MNVNMLKRGKRLIVFMMITMLLAGSVNLPVAAAESGESEPVFDQYKKNNTDNTSDDDEMNADVEDADPVCMVTLNANGGVFAGEYDDVINETIETTEILNKLIPAGGVVNVIPVYFDGNEKHRFTGWSLEADGALVSESDLSYVPVGDCTLYAIWEQEDPIETPASDEGELLEEGGIENPAENIQTNDEDKLERPGEDTGYIPEDATFTEGLIDDGSGDNEEYVYEDISKGEDYNEIGDFEDDNIETSFERADNRESVEVPDPGNENKENGEQVDSGTEADATDNSDTDNKSDSEANQAGASKSGNTDNDSKNKTEIEAAESSSEETVSCC